MARPGAVLSMVLREGGLLVAAGVCIGVVASLVLSQVLPLSSSASALAMSWRLPAPSASWRMVALLATLLPARRAARIPPMVALRNE